MALILLRGTWTASNPGHTTTCCITASAHQRGKANTSRNKELYAWVHQSANNISWRTRSFTSLLTSHPKRPRVLRSRNWSNLLNRPSKSKLKNWQLLFFTWAITFQHSFDKPTKPKYCCCWTPNCWSKAVERSPYEQVVVGSKSRWVRGFFLCLPSFQTFLKCP